MNRLTEKINNYYFSKGKIESDHNDELLKLGQLEDIEDKLKCPLDVFLQIFSKGIYVKSECTKGKIEYWSPFQIKVIDAGSQWDICKIGSKSNQYVSTFNYLQSWSLNKEDL